MFLGREVPDHPDNYTLLELCRENFDFLHADLIVIRRIISRVQGDVELLVRCAQLVVIILFVLAIAVTLSLFEFSVQVTIPFAPPFDLTECLAVLHLAGWNLP